MASTFYLCPLASFLQVFSDIGIPLSGGLIWTYQAGTSTPTATWTDITGTTPNSNPIQLNSAGRLNNVSIWQQGGMPLKIVFSTNAGTSGSPAFGSQIGPVFDEVSGIDDPVATLATLANAASGSGADIVANAVRSYDIVSSVRAANVPTLSAGQTLIIIVEGGTSPADGAGGQFYWNSSSTATDDGTTVIKPNALSSGSPGRYLVFLLGQQFSSGSFLATLTGMAFTTQPTVYWSKAGLNIVLMIPASSNGSNANTFTMTGLPSNLQPATRAQTVQIPDGSVLDNSSITFNCSASLSPNSGTVTFLKSGVSATWNTGGVKGFGAGVALAYSVL